MSVYDRIERDLRHQLASIESCYRAEVAPIINKLVQIEAMKPPRPLIVSMADLGTVSSTDQQTADLAIDARRYRYMREHARFEWRNGPGLYWYLPQGLSGGPGVQLDEAIDMQLGRKP